MDEYQSSSQGKKKTKSSKDNILYEVEIVEVDNLIKRRKKLRFTSKPMVTTQMSGVIAMRTMFLLSGLKRCMFPMKTL